MKKLFLASFATIFFTVNFLATFISAEEISNVNSASIRVYYHEEDKIVNMNVEEYIVGVLVGEMYPDASFEALKAMAVAARTYTLYMAEKNKNKDYDVSTNPDEYQAFSRMTLKNADSYKEMERAVKDTYGEIITYQGNLILSLYHASSLGKTENSENVFVESLPYLVSVDTPFENEENAYCNSSSYSFEEFNMILELNNQPRLHLKNTTIKIIENNNGRCKTLILADNDNGVYIDSKDVRRMFNLRSTDFCVKLNEKEIEFITYGFGHGVGLSQNGANIMAENGYSYVDILEKYYSDCNVIKTIYKSWIYIKQKVKNICEKQRKRYKDD